MPSYEQPKRSTCNSLSKMIRSLMRRRWQPSGCSGSYIGRLGSNASNWTHKGSTSQDGRAGTDDLVPDHRA